MEFDKSKILTCVTADQAKVGDVGWFADNLEDLKNHVASGKPEPIKQIMDESNINRFLKYNSKWALFYPAPYSYLQEKWVKENNLKVGDRVRITSYWGTEGLDFSEIYTTAYLLKEGSVISINPDMIVLQLDFCQASVPYFAIEKVKEPEYRRFANAEEFAPYRDEWFSWVGGDERDACRVTSYGDDGVVIAGEVIDYERFCGEWRFSSDTGKSAGVKV